MIRITGGARHIRLLLIFAAALTFAGEAVAQCPEPAPAIEGPSTMCQGQMVELIGPFDMAEYAWTGPGGFIADTWTINVNEPGTYTLSVRSVYPCWSPTTSFNLTIDTPPPPAVTGIDSVCTGQAVQLCGPPGMLEYAWSGPFGFGAVTECVTVSDPGTYTLVTRGDGIACYSNPRDFVLREGSCAPPPDPDPDPGPGPAPVRPSCPRPASWWTRALLPPPDGGARFTQVGLNDIAACIDQGCTQFTWFEPREGFNQVLRDRNSLRDRALRQLATVAANVCAWTTEAPQSATPLVGLDPSRSLALETTTAPTVAQWLAETEATLAQLAGSTTRGRDGKDVKKEYRRIIRSGWAINHGLGVGPVCDTTAATARKVQMAAVTSEDDEVEVETLDEELSIEAGQSALEIEAAAPNPFRQTTRFVYYVGDTGGQTVELGIVDLSGRRIRKLVSATLSQGPHEVIWDGRDDAGRSVNNGVYFVHGRVGVDRVSSTLTLLR